MGKPPAVLIVVRHGARLDQADKQWINTSATPYDPPLTYGGWTQARALGARIASILKARERAQASAPSPAHSDDELHHDTPDARGAKLAHRSSNHPAKSNSKHTSHKKPLRHKVIIHSSPFLRCVQTSIGISAGMAQWDSVMRLSSEGHTHKHNHFHGNSGRLHSAGVLNSPHLAAIPEPGEDLARLAVKNAILSRKKYQKCTVRIDACLGEWLQPDYFELISQPPSSKLMVAGAKAELLKRSDCSSIPNAISVGSGSNQQGFPGGWVTPHVLSSPIEGPLSSMALLRENLPQRDRASSHSGVSNAGSRATSRLNTAVSSDPDAYTPPTPTWAISPSDPIPDGYVAHAQEACTEVDYQWDSMRPPQSWGDGGEYGEEWASMHKRFRKGVQHLIHWYSQHNTSTTSSDVCSDAINGQSANHDPKEHNDDDDSETVIIMVTHGAGCNALLGALTDSPVLMDIGLASLSLAVRKDHGSEKHSSAIDLPYNPVRRVSGSTGIADDYDVRLSASTEHLRAGSNPLAIPQLQSRGAASPGSHRHRAESDTGSESEFFVDEVRGRRGAKNSGISSSIGSIRRVVTTSLPNYARSASTSNTPTGLWSPQIRPAASSFSVSENGDDDGVLNFDAADETSSRASSGGSFSDKPAVRNGSWHPDLPEDSSFENKQHFAEKTASPVVEPDVKRLPPTRSETSHESIGKPFNGLWGASITVHEEKVRAPGPKRRWTVDERSARP